MESRRGKARYEKGTCALSRFIATPVCRSIGSLYGLSVEVCQRAYVFAREDDYFFGVLHSRIHEVWAAYMGTVARGGEPLRYTPSSTFETFPLPWAPGEEPKDHP